MPSSSSSSSTKATCLVLVVVLLLSHCATSLIIPEELPTILSLIYSNIPPIKKGTDSRLGLGFRLGEHADFQVLLELGPQKATDPIGNSVDNKRKRAAMLMAAMKGELGPFAQTIAKYQMEQKLKKALETYKLSSKTKDNSILITDEKSDANEWLSKWSQGLVVSPEISLAVNEEPTRNILPNVNRIRVTNVPTNPNSQTSAQSDLDSLKKLYEKNANDTKSVT